MLSYKRYWSIFFFLYREDVKHEHQRENDALGESESLRGNQSEEKSDLKGVCISALNAPKKRKIRVDIIHQQSPTFTRHQTPRPSSKKSKTSLGRKALEDPRKKPLEESAQAIPGNEIKFFLSGVRAFTKVGGSNFGSDEFNFWASLFGALRFQYDHLNVGGYV